MVVNSAIMPTDTMFRYLRGICVLAFRGNAGEASCFSPTVGAATGGVDCFGRECWESDSIAFIAHS
jgi:hypothetical protein